MRKSDGFHFSGLYGAILADIAVEYPNDVQEWNRDKTRLRSIVDQEGDRFFTITLPAVGKALDRALSTGVLHRLQLPHFRGYRRGGAIPRLFRALFLRIFDDQGVLKPNPDIRAVRFLRQLLYVAKKVRLPCASTVLFKTVQAFWEVEEEIRSPSCSWDGDRLLDNSGVCLNGNRLQLSLSDGSGYVRSSSDQLSLFSLLDDNLVEDTKDEERSRFKDVRDVIQRVADSIVYNLPEFLPRDYRFKHGPGAVSDLGREGDKYTFPTWPAKLDEFFSHDEFAYANLGVFEETTLGGLHSYHSRYECPSKLCAVPKTLKAPRLIASEPVSHQWCQQSMKDFFYRSLKQTVLGSCIDFRRQDLSRELALQASRDGKLATVDLSEASDRLSCWLVERLFRSRFDLLSAMHAVRTRWLVNKIDKKLPSHIVLRKFSTMGNALTFPVQSMVFAIVSMGVYLYRREIPVDSRSLARAAKEVRIFGDDIICPSEDVGLLTEVLADLGLKVNTSKTFAEGFFREACGMDAYMGVEVTPTYVLEVSNETRPGIVASIVDTSNNLFIQGYWRTSQWILSTLPDQIVKNLAVMPIGAGGLSLSSFCGRFTDHLAKRWNHELHRFEFRHLTLSSREKVRRRDSHATLLQYFTEATKYDSLGMLPRGQLGVKSRPKDKMSLRWGHLEPA
nr:MAG: putative replicase protein [Leviviridae sp.]